MKKIHLYFREKPADNRFFKGEKHLKDFIKILMGKNKIGGVKKVFNNLCKGFDELKINYDINIPYREVKPNEPVVVLGAGRFSLSGYNIANPIVAGIGLMTHPSEWPELFNEYPVAKYLQHSKWANDVYINYYARENCELWPAGIDTKKWVRGYNSKTRFDFLIYNKIRWNNETLDSELKNPILKYLKDSGLSYHEITYGHYTEKEYHKLLRQCKSMIFLCEHESQGIACCEALAMNVPVLAWDQGLCLDPNRFKWNDPAIPATSVPFFNEYCGMRFNNFAAFESTIEEFWNAVNENKFEPRSYILENLTLQKSAETMLDIINSVYK